MTSAGLAGKPEAIAVVYKLLPIPDKVPYCSCNEMCDSLVAGKQEGTAWVCAKYSLSVSLHSQATI